MLRSRDAFVLGPWQTHLRNTNNKPAVQADDQRQAMTAPTVESRRPGFPLLGKTSVFRSIFRDEVEGGIAKTIEHPPAPTDKLRRQTLSEIG
jgi:hypothetical protein